jgi:K+-sensing histidine kinase KdpD
MRELLHEELECLSAELQGSQVTVVGIVPVDFPEIIAVGQKLQRILELLIKYKMARLAPPAKVQVTARLCRTGTFTGDELELEVGDTGSGPLKMGGRLPAKQVIVEADCRLNRMLSSIIVHQQGGRMNTHREEGKGTTFLIRLPVSRSES